MRFAEETALMACNAALSPPILRCPRWRLAQ